MSLIPDGTTLLLKPRADDLLYENDIYSIKHDGRVYLSFVDFIDVLELQIDFDPEMRTGEGWFLRESWPFTIDLDAKTVESGGSQYDIEDSDIYIEGDLVFIASEALSDWMSMGFEYDLSQQYMEVFTPFPLAAVAKDIRRRRELRDGSRSREAVLPRYEGDNPLLYFDAASVNAGVRYSRASSGSSRTLNTTNVSAQGQVLDHEAFAFASRDSFQGLTNARVRLSKQSETPDLLGPLNARYYEIGDVDSTEIPLTGDSLQTLGFSLNNNPLVNPDFTVTDIEGDGIPDWDIELYRNGVIIDTLTIEDDGRYAFSNVNLFAGDNEFELFFYGPQGQIRSENLSIPVTADLLSTQKDTYEVSVNLEETNTFRGQISEDPDQGELNIAGRYNKFFGSNLGYVGFRSRSIEGERKNFLSSGMTSIVGPAIVDTNFAIDDQANAAAEFAVRGRLDEWNLSLNGGMNSDEYIVADTLDPTVLNINASAQRRLKPLFGDNANLITGAGYSETADGTAISRARLGLSQRINGINLSNNYLYETISGSNAPIDERLESSFSARGNIGKLFLRGGFDYDVKPTTRIDRIFSQLNYRHKYNQTYDAQLIYEPDRDFSSGRFNASYTNKYFRTSPFVQIDSNDQLLAGVNVNFDIMNTPYDGAFPQITSERLMGRSSVTGFVYHDKNGNFIYDEEDEVLPDVYVESINTRKKAATNDTGFAVLQALATSQPTDIQIDENTLPDSFMISAAKGASVFPNAGQNYRLDFPVHIAGEIDGTMYITDRKQERKAYGNKDVELLSLDNPERDPISAAAAYDGFYLLAKVPPGRYLMMPKLSQSRAKIGNAVPPVLDIGFDGTVIYDQDVDLYRGAGFAAYEVRHTYSAKPKAEIYTLKVKFDQTSKLSGIIHSLLLKKYAMPVLNTLRPAQYGGDIEESQYRYFAGTQQELHNACSLLDYYNIECSIIVEAFTSKAKPNTTITQAAL